MNESNPPVPAARIEPERRISFVWLLPLAALALAGWLGYRAWSLRGVTVLVHLEQGHGLRAGDEVRYRGTSVGEVRRIDLEREHDGVLVTIGLHAGADLVARGGSRFWVVRPQLGLTSVEGLETLIGPRYLAVLPGDGPPQRRFVGLADSPVVPAYEPGDLEIVVECSQGGSLARGVPVIYRQVRVGTVLSVGLGSDAGSVEARVHIEGPYAELVRTRTAFWDAGGITAQVGLTGLRVEIESVETALSGALALATPPSSGEVVHTGHRFRLRARPPEDWIEWDPLVVIGSALLPAGRTLPTPLRATLAWEQGLFRGRRMEHGWVLSTADGLLGPASLLRPTDKADRDTVVLELMGAVMPLTADPTWERGGLALGPIHVNATAWPRDRCARPPAPVDCIAVADASAPPLPLAAARLTADADAWIVDGAISIDDSWHGACVLDRSTGHLVGILLTNRGTLRVALLPEAALPE